MLPGVVVPFDYVRRIRRSNCSTFSDICKDANLNPATSFIGADLSFVDFTGSDLRGFNFQGANLFGAKFSNAIVDSTTNFESSVEQSSGDIFLVSGERRSIRSSLGLSEFPPQEVTIFIINGLKYVGQIVFEDLFSVLLQETIGENGETSGADAESYEPSFRLIYQSGFSAVFAGKLDLRLDVHMNLMTGVERLESGEPSTYRDVQRYLRNCGLANSRFT